MNAAKHAIEIIERMYCVLLMANVTEEKMKSVINASTVHKDVKDLVIKLIDRVKAKDDGYGY